MLPLRQDYLPFSRPSFGPEEEREIIECLRSGWITTGPRTHRFEEAFAAFCGAPHAVACNSGTSALQLAVAALGLGPGDDVLVPSFTWVSTAAVVAHQGARPVLCEIDPQAWTMDPVWLERFIETRYKKDAAGLMVGPEGGRPRAMIPVHYAGQAADMAPLMELARKYGLKVIEDAAHCVGSTYQGRHLGLIGDVGCFSFYANKNMTTAEGGMLICRDQALADKLRVLGMHGLSKDAWKRYAKGGSWWQPVVELGFKFNMTDIAASLGLHQLAKVEGFNQRRRQLAAIYDQGLSGLTNLNVCQDLGRGVHARHLYAICLEPGAPLDKTAMIAALAQRNIGAGVHYIPVHIHPYYQDNFGYKRGDLPVTERVYDGQISLPLFPDMTDDDAAYVIDSVRGLLAG